MTQEKEKTTSSGKIKKTSTSETIQIRNRFLYIHYRKLSLIFVGTLILCAISLMAAFYFATKKTPPVYIPISNKGQVVVTYPLNQPAHPDPEVMNAWVSQWCLEAARKSFSYDYMNFTEQINAAQSYFTYRGWDQFSKKMTESQNFNTVQLQKMIVKFTPKTAPVIRKAAIKDGRLAWAVDLPGKFQFNAHDGKNNGFLQNVVIHFVVVRMSTTDSPKGIGIDQMVVEEIEKTN